MTDESVCLSVTDHSDCKGPIKMPSCLLVSTIPLWMPPVEKRNVPQMFSLFTSLTLGVHLRPRDVYDDVDDVEAVGASFSPRSDYDVCQGDWS